MASRESEMYDGGCIWGGHRVGIQVSVKKEAIVADCR